MPSSRLFTEALYERFKRDRRALHPGWRRYFDEIEGTPREVQPASVLEHLPHVVSVSLFRDLPLSEQALVASGVEPVELQPEQVVFREGDPGDALYIVTNGSLRVMRGGSVLGLIGPGEVAGELAVVDKKPRSADVIAHGPARLLKLPAPAFDELVSRNPELASGLMQVLAGRMRSANAQQERVDLLIRSYRNRGHGIARLDPLGRGITALDELELLYDGLSEAELDLPFSMKTSLSWVQEEPRNMGAWTFLRLLAGEDFWGGRRVRCIAREESASPATGSAAAHKRQQQALVEHALA